MENQQHYSHGLLFSVAPDSFPSLNLRYHNAKDSIDWEAYKFQYENDSFLQSVMNFFRRRS